MTVYPVHADPMYPTVGGWDNKLEIFYAPTRRFWWHRHRLYLFGVRRGDMQWRCARCDRKFITDQHGRLFDRRRPK